MASVSKQISASPDSALQPIAPFSFDLKQASAYTGISSWSLRSAIWGGQLRAHQCNKKYVITKNDLESFVTNLDEVRSLKCVNTAPRKRTRSAAVLSRRAEVNFQS